MECGGRGGREEKGVGRGVSGGEGSEPDQSKYVAPKIGIEI